MLLYGIRWNKRKLYLLIFFVGFLVFTTPHLSVNHNNVSILKIQMSLMQY